MSTSSKILSAIAAALVAAACAAPATVTAAGLSTREYTVDVTGIHHVDWSWQAAGAGQECRDWTAGDGEHTIGFSQPRPARYTLMTLPGRGKPGVTWLPTRRGTTKITARRTTRHWKDHLAPGRCSPCDQEGGGCSPPPDRPQPPAPPACPARHPRGAIMVMYYPDGHVPDDDDELIAPLHPDGPALQIQAGVRTGDAFSTCLPDRQRPLHLATPDPWTVSIFGVRRLDRLKPGGRLTLKGSFDGGAAAAPDQVPTLKRSLKCDKALGGPGYTECAVTDVTVEIRRGR